MFRQLSRQTLKAIPRSRIVCSRPVHNMSVPYSGPPSYSTIRRRLSFSYPDPQEFVIRKHQQEALERGKFTDIHDVDPGYSPDPTEYDVLLTDITHGKLESTIAEELGIPYLSKATEADAKEIVQVAEGYIYGLHKRTIVPFVVSNGNEARWFFFIVDSGSSWTYISDQASKLMGFGSDTMVTIGGHDHLIHVPPATSHFSDVNILGTDFCYMKKILKAEDYRKRRVKMYFGNNWECKVFEKP